MVLRKHVKSCLVMILLTIAPWATADTQFRLIVDASGSMLISDPDKLTAESLKLISDLAPEEQATLGVWWLPDTCSYRVLYQTGDLPNWHPLVVGSDREMKNQGLNVSHYAVNENTVDEERWEEHIIKWVHGMPEPYDPTY